MQVSRRAICAVSEVTKLEKDLCEFLVQEIVSADIPEDPDEDTLAELLGEHLVNFGVCDSVSLAWVVCDKIIKEFQNRDAPADLLRFEGEDDVDEEDEWDGEEGICPICSRELPLTFHHLIPKSTHRKMIKLGHTKEKLNSTGVNICRPCHSHVHRVIPLMDMALTYNTLESILLHPGVQKWIPYIRKQKITSKCDVRVNRIQNRNLVLPKEDLLLSNEYRY